MTKGSHVYKSQNEDRFSAKGTEAGARRAADAGAQITVSTGGADPMRRLWQRGELSRPSETQDED